MFFYKSDDKNIELIRHFLGKEANQFSFCYNYSVFFERRLAATFSLIDRESHNYMVKSSGKEFISYLGFFHILFKSGPAKRINRLVKEIAPGALYIYNIAVDSEFRRRGIGKLIMEYCENYGAAGGYERILLDVELDNLAALTLYNKSGFRSTGRYCDNYLADKFGFSGFHRMEKGIEPIY